MLTPMPQSALYFSFFIFFSDFAARSLHLDWLLEHVQLDLVSLVRLKAANTMLRLSARVHASLTARYTAVLPAFVPVAALHTQRQLAPGNDYGARSTRNGLLLSAAPGPRARPPPLVAPLSRFSSSSSDPTGTDSVIRRSIVSTKRVFQAAFSSAAPAMAPNASAAASTAAASAAAAAATTATSAPIFASANSAKASGVTPPAADDVSPLNGEVATAGPSADSSKTIANAYTSANSAAVSASPSGPSPVTAASLVSSLFSSSTYGFDGKSAAELYEAAAAVSSASLAQLTSQSSLPWATLRLALDAFRVSVRRAEDYYGSHGAQGVLSISNYAQLLVGLGELAGVGRRKRVDDWHIKEVPAARADVERLAAYAPIAHAAYKVRPALSLLIRTRYIALQNALNSLNLHYLHSCSVFSMFVFYCDCDIEHRVRVRGLVRGRGRGRDGVARRPGGASRQALVFYSQSTDCDANNNIDRDFNCVII